MLLAFVRFCFLALLGIVILYPILYSVSVALRSADQLYDPLVVLIPKSITLANIKNAFALLDYPAGLLKSFGLVSVSSVLQISGCSLVGYGLARFKFRGKGLIFALVILVVVVPPQTVIIPNYMQFRYFDPLGIVTLINALTGHQYVINLINTNWAFYLPAAFGMGIRSGIFIFIFRQFFRGMPRELEEAALVDGCGPLRCFMRIIVPNAGASYLTAFLFSVVWYWNDYIYTTVFAPNSGTVMNALYHLKDNADHIMQYEMKASPYEGILLLQSGVLLGILPLLVLYILLQKHFTESIARAGIVG
ncbi:MAG: carbohydrate ABC transporter permease [Clostridiales Family XIII bacterium]|nr:carbohydrate ABC transporter permease [Clostridiales Family XIII bacterium]